MPRLFIGLLLGGLFAAALVFATLREATVQCEVCIDFDGRSACRSASGADRDAALRGATTAACAVLADGVTRGIQCDGTPPRSQRCSE